MSMNQVFLLGNLTRDPEVKFTASNKAVANFGIAVNNKYKAADGTSKEEVTFVDCEAWGATAENIGKFFSKGKQILIDGRLRLDAWQDKVDGTNRSKLKVVVNNFHFTGPKDPGQNTSPPARAARPYVQPQPTQEDDIPFDYAPILN